MGESERGMKKLDARLASALPFVRQNSFLADVGTDHAYLPIELYLRGRIRGAVASDINQGPLERALANIRAAGAEAGIHTVQTDGLQGLDRYHPDDITIFGMGGELICEILRAAPFVRDSSIRLILQPMTHPEKMRSFLLAQGFCIIGEALSRSEGRIYQTVCAVWDGIDRLDTYTPFDCLFGKENRMENTPLYRELLAVGKRVMSKRLNGKRLAGQNTEYEEEILKEIAIWEGENP